MEIFKSDPPTDREIDKAQLELGFTFTEEYIHFIKSGYDLGSSFLEALEISARGTHLDIFEVIKSARKYYGLPSNLLPICEDNSDYYCVNSIGEVVFWSHNGLTSEKWENVNVWRDAMIRESEE